MKTKVKLKIANISIYIESAFTLEGPNRNEDRCLIPERLANFFDKDSNRPDITIEVSIVKELPRVGKIENIFVTTHFQSGKENWRIGKKGTSFIYRCPLENKRELAIANKGFDKATVYLLPKIDKSNVWKITDVIYDFLQILLINYLALRGEGVFVHGVGVKDLDGRGLLFVGRSGAGKSTTARLWDRHSRAMVLNDDRTIVRKMDGKFFVFGSPWHGDFSDYLYSRIEAAQLSKLFFIWHYYRNTAKSVTARKAFTTLYPSTFPTFWDKDCLEKVVSFCEDLVKNTPCFNLGFVNDKRIIEFIRGI